jgi:hypothetical protein
VSEGVIDDLEDFLQWRQRVAGVRRRGRRALDVQKIGQERGLMSTHASVLVDSVGPPSAEVCRTAASFP